MGQMSLSSRTFSVFILEEAARLGNELIFVLFLSRGHYDSSEQRMT